MQTAVPETLQLEKETEATRTLYGLDQRRRRGPSASCAWRRGGWSSAACASCRSSTAAAAAAPGTPTRGIKRQPRPAVGPGRSADRRPAQGPEAARHARRHARRLGHRVRPLAGRQGDGRDHHPQGFCAWLAGGGIKGGVVHGATDEIGFHAVEDRHYVTDIHATVLHQLGLDPRRLEVPGPQAARDRLRQADPRDPGVVSVILAPSARSGGRGLP